MTKKFSIYLPHGTIEADSYSSFRGRIKNEQKYWSSIGAEWQKHAFWRGVAHPIEDPLENRIGRILGFWDSKSAQLDEIDGGSFDSFFPAFKDEIELSDFVPPHSKSSVAQSIKRLLDSGDQQHAAAILMGYAFARDPSIYQGNNRQEAIGAFAGFIMGVYGAEKARELVTPATTDDLASEKVLAEEIVDSLSTNLAEQTKDIEAHEKLIDQKLKNSTRKALSKYRQLLRGQRNLSKNLEERGLEREKEFEALKRAFNTEMRLKWPVELWKDRQSEHQTSSEAAWVNFKVASLALGLAALIVAFALGDTIASTFVPSTCVIGLEPSCDRISPKGPLTVSMLILISTVWLWYLRLQMKVHLSERHLALDARERRAFAETYLSLLKGDQVTQEHEVVVLQSLFRPTQVGIIRDDGGPDIGVASL